MRLDTLARIPGWYMLWRTNLDAPNLLFGRVSRCRSISGEPGSITCVSEPMLIQENRVMETSLYITDLLHSMEDSAKLEWA